VISVSSFITCQHRFRRTFLKRNERGKVLICWSRFLLVPKLCAGLLCRKLVAKFNWRIFQVFASLAPIGGLSCDDPSAALERKGCKSWDKRCATLRDTWVHPRLTGQITHTRMACLCESRGGAACVKSFPICSAVLSKSEGAWIALVRIAKSGYITIGGICESDNTTIGLQCSQDAWRDRSRRNRSRSYRRLLNGKSITDFPLALTINYDSDV
jgi:hypothetical protein